MLARNLLLAAPFCWYLLLLLLPCHRNWPRFGRSHHRAWPRADRTLARPERDSHARPDLSALRSRTGCSPSHCLREASGRTVCRQQMRARVPCTDDALAATASGDAPAAPRSSHSCIMAKSRAQGGLALQLQAILLLCSACALPRVANGQCSNSDDASCSKGELPGAASVDCARACRCTCTHVSAVNTLPRRPIIGNVWHACMHACVRAIPCPPNATPLLELNPQVSAHSSVLACGMSGWCRTRPC